MRIAMTLALSLALAFQAAAQTEPKRRAFTEADYATFFSPGIRQYATAPAERQGILAFSRRGGDLMLKHTEAMPKWDPGSLYPFVKVILSYKAEIGSWDNTTKASVYRATEADVESTKNAIVWLSNNNRPEISADDARVGTLWGYYVSLARKHRTDVNQLEAWLRRETMGIWSMRCEFVRDATYEFECVHTHLDDGAKKIRRYLKRTAMG